MDVPLSDDQRREAEKLFEEYKETIQITARRASLSWCSGYDFDELLQEGHVCLLSAAGLLGTPGKWDPNRVGKDGRKATFKTYFIQSLLNWYRDLGSRQAYHSSKVTYVAEYVDPPVDRRVDPMREGDDELYIQLWKVLSP